MSEQEFIELINLCNYYGYRYDKIGYYIRIHSKRDTWFIYNIDYLGHKIELYHQNEKGNSGKHSHGKHNTLQDVFKCIYSHDNREILRNNKVIRLSNIYKTIKI